MERPRRVPSGTLAPGACLHTVRFVSVVEPVLDKGLGGLDRVLVYRACGGTLPVAIDVVGS